MNFELAKELKEAGYPQEGKTDNYWAFDGYCRAYRSYFEELEWPNLFYIPTLEELIEACGDEFMTLSLRPKSIGIDLPDTKWSAFTTIHAEMIGHGSTPIEAVARLWLALKRKTIGV